jgi:hypothetical protein
MLTDKREDKNSLMNRSKQTQKLIRVNTILIPHCGYQLFKLRQIYER